MDTNVSTSVSASVSTSVSASVSASVDASIIPYIKQLNELRVGEEGSAYNPIDCYNELVSIRFNIMKYADMAIDDQEKLQDEIHVEDEAVNLGMDYIRKPFITHCNLHTRTLIKVFVINDPRVSICSYELQLMARCCSTYGFRYQVISNVESNRLRMWCSQANVSYTILPPETLYEYYKGVRDTLPSTPTPVPKDDNLRDYQIKCLEQMERVTDHGVFRLPCGTGKSIIMITYILRHGINSIILVPNISLVSQFKNNIDKVKGTADPKIICLSSRHVDRLPDRFDDKHQYIVICVYNTFVRYATQERFEGFDMFIDEAHHIMHPSKYGKANTYIENILAAEDDEEKFMRRLEAADTFKRQFSDKIFSFASRYCHKTFYFSATVENAFSPINMLKAIENGYMCKLNIKILHTCTTVDDVENRKSVLLSYFRKDNDIGKSIIIYTRTCADAACLKKTLDEQFKFRSEVVKASTSESIRANYFKDFEERKIRCLLTVNCISEGVDLPHADEAIFFADKESIVNICQSVGRILRKPDGKLSSTLVVFANGDRGSELTYTNIIGVLNGQFGYHGCINMKYVVFTEFLDTPEHKFSTSEKEHITTCYYDNNERKWRDSSAKALLNELKGYIGYHRRLPTAGPLREFVEEHKRYDDSVWTRISEMIRDTMLRDTMMTTYSSA